MSHYKYREFTESHVNALIENKLIFSQCDNFNDPFDSQPPINIVTYASLKKLVQDRPLSALLSPEQLHETVLAEIEDVNKHINEGRFEEHPIYNYFDTIRQVVYPRLIYCLSQTNRNILLWSHYASSHTGFCIKYDLDLLLENINICYHDEVTYNNTLPDLMLSLFDDCGGNFVKEILFQKSEDWSYEKEYRLILDGACASENGEIKAVEYPPKAVKRIYFGLQSDITNREQLMESLAGRDIEFFEMVKAKSTIGIYANKI